MAIQGIGAAIALASTSPTYTLVDTVVHRTIYPDGSTTATTDKTVTYSAQNTGNTTETVVTYATSGSARGARPFTTPVTPGSNAVGPYGAQINFSPEPTEQLDGTLSTFSVFA